MKQITCYSQNLNLQKFIQNEREVLSEQSIIICDLSNIVEKYELWAKTMPRVKPFYAVKCNDDPKIVKLLSQLGCGFDCASKNELDQVLSYGISGDDIIFAQTNKMRSHLEYARLNSVPLMTFDGEDELLKIKQYFPQAQLLMRIRCDASKAIHKLGEKFGCDPDLDGFSLLVKAKDLDLNVVGVCFHVGSGCQELGAFDRALKMSAKLFKIATGIGFDMKILDIGGGFPGDNDEKFLKTADIINLCLDDYFSEYKTIEVIAEPGRYFVESAQTLLTEIHSKREIWRENILQKIMYFINDGIYGTLNFIYYENKNIENKITIFDPNDYSEIIEDELTYKTTIWGPTCASEDQIVTDVYLPKLNIGTVLAIKDCGAYALQCATRFNGYPGPQLKFVIKEKDVIKIFRNNPNANINNLI